MNPATYDESDSRSKARSTRAPQNSVETQLPKYLQELRYLGGEAALGLSVGAVAGWMTRKFQSVLVTLVIAASIGSAAALHLGWTTPEQVWDIERYHEG